MYNFSSEATLNILHSPRTERQQRESGVHCCAVCKHRHQMYVPCINPISKGKRDGCITKVLHSVKGSCNDPVLGDCAGSCKGCPE